jgi:hypothetical protein
VVEKVVVVVVERVQVEVMGARNWWQQRERSVPRQTNWPKWLLRQEKWVRVEVLPWQKKR